MAKKTVLLCIGTRPEIIKMAPVYHALSNHRFDPIILHTGQHKELAEEFYPFFQMTPNFHFKLNRKTNSLSHLFGLLIDYIDSILLKVKPDTVLVQGDTSSAFAGALAAFYHKIPVGHIEAGLRSNNEYQPYPEEKNRELITRLTRWHFVPTENALNNLFREGIDKEQCHLVGNTIVDAVFWALRQAQKPGELLHPDFSEWLKAHADSRLLLVTAHRRESWDGEIASIARGIHEVLKKHKDIHVVWPVHPNPIVKNAVHERLQDLDPNIEKRVWLTDCIAYPELIHLIKQAWLVLTDSGGIQEEAITLNTPVLVLRDQTERPEVEQFGGGKVIGTQSQAIIQWVEKLTTDTHLYQSLNCDDNPFGDGHAADRIADHLQYHLDHGAEQQPQGRKI